MGIDNVYSELSSIKRWDLFQVETVSQPVEFENNAPRRIERKQSQGAALRLIDNDRIGFAATRHPEHFKLLVQRARASAEYGEKPAFEPVKPGEIPSLDCYDTRLESFTPDQAVEIGNSMIESILAEQPSLQITGIIEPEFSTTRIRWSGDEERSYRASGLYIMLEALQVDEDGLTRIWDSVESAALNVEPQHIVRSILRHASLAQRSAVISTGTYPVLLTPKALPSVLQAFQLGLNGKMVQKGVSPLRQKLGETILSERITILDDPLIPLASGSRPFDDEGMASRRLPLVHQGRVEHFALDLQTAGLLGREPTASAQRGLYTLPSPAYTNFVVAPGDLTLEEMIEGISEGLLVDQILGGGQSNLLMGEFSLNLDLGFKIERGKITGRVKDTMIAGNAYEAFNRIGALGSEVGIYHGCHSPAILFDGIHVASAK